MFELAGLPDATEDLGAAEEAGGDGGFLSRFNTVADATCWSHFNPLTFWPFTR